MDDDFDFWCCLVIAVVALILSLACFGVLAFERPSLKGFEPVCSKQVYEEVITSICVNQGAPDSFVINKSLCKVSEINNVSVGCDEYVLRRIKDETSKC